uniref:RRM domain-containing protein n=1 Tax=Astyanax mexicanus TaxID=7994 RepID=A0A8B9HH73_ASTMX
MLRSTTALMHAFFLFLHSDDAEDASTEKSDGKDKEKSGGGRKSGRYHPYKDRHGGSENKKASQRNRVFISNIPYDMKWQAIKDLMRDKGKGCRAYGTHIPSSSLCQHRKRLFLIV